MGDTFEGEICLSVTRGARASGGVYMQGFYDDWRADLLTGPYWIHTPNNFLNLCTNNCDFCRKKNLVAEMLNTVLKCNHAQEFEAGFDPSEKWTACIENNK